MGSGPDPGTPAWKRTRPKALYGPFPGFGESNPAVIGGNSYVITDFSEE